MWLKMSDVARELGVSKDVVKYHKKSLPKEEIWLDDGVIMISSLGVEIIKSKLKKDTYNENFDVFVRKKLNVLEKRLENLDEFLVKKLLIEPSIVEKEPLDPLKEKTYDLAEEINNELTEGFKAWYCQSKNIDEWNDWRMKFVSLSEFLKYLEQKSD